LYLRAESERVRIGDAGRNIGVLEGMAGVAVPISTATGAPWSRSVWAR